MVLFLDYSDDSAKSAIIPKYSVKKTENSVRLGEKKHSNNLFLV